MKFDVKVFALSILFSIILVTILSMLISNYSSVPVLKTGSAFILIFIGVYVTLIFSVAHDWKFEKNEIFLLIFVALSLLGIMWAMKRYFPELFSILPKSTRDVFSAVIP